MKITAHVNTPEELQAELVKEFNRQLTVHRESQSNIVGVRASAVKAAEIRMLQSVVNLISSIEISSNNG